MSLELFDSADCKHIVDEVLYGHSVRQLSCHGALCRVVTEGGCVGYAKKEALWDAPPLPPSAFRAAYRADVLKTPDVKAEKLFVLPRFSLITVLGTCGAFYRVRLLDGREGYVHRRHLLPPPDKATADAVCDTALSLLGVPYRFGGRSAVALDCSGLVSLSFGFHGVTLPRDTAKMHSLTEVERSAARRGDLVLFSEHVGLLLTPTRFLHASASVGYVSVASLDAAHPLYDARHAEDGYTVRRVL